MVRDKTFKPFVLVLLVLLFISSCLLLSNLYFNKFIQPVEHSRSVAVHIESRSSIDSKNRIVAHQVVARDEFMITDEKGGFLPFSFNFTPPGDDYGRLESLYQCSDTQALTGRPKKLIFVHLLRNAGSTVRSILEEYAKVCHAGIAVVLACAELSWASTRKDLWVNEKAEDGKGPRCILKKALNRTGHKIKPEKDYFFRTSFLERNVDILAGHVPLGSDVHWHADTSQLVDAQYVMFFRNPVEKFVSTVMLANKENPTTLNETISFIKDKVKRDCSKGLYFESYTRSMITPEQRAWLLQAGINPTVEERVNLALTNLVKHKVMIGLTEHMSESLEMLQYVIDSDREITNVFDSFGSSINNPSIISTSLVADGLRNDNTFGLLEKYLKYEILIYFHARHMHERQYQWFQQLKKNRVP